MSQTTLRIQAMMVLLLIEVSVDANVSSGCVSRNLSVTADDNLRLYIDGQEVRDLRFADDWFYPDTVKFPCTARVIAIEANNTYQIGAVMASTDDGYIKTNSSWKCTNTRMKGWQEVDFDDSSWKQAVVVPYHDGFPESTLLRKDARWIWTKDYTTPSVFCRLKLDVDDCLFGQPINECDSSMGRCTRSPKRGGYNCSCFHGYQNDGQQKCKDVDECLLGSAENMCDASSGNCINTPGSYRCRCYEGFTNAGDQRQCQGSSNNAMSLIILGVSLGISLLIIVALIVALHIRCSRTSTTKDPGADSVDNTDAKQSDINRRIGGISSNKPSTYEEGYSHLNLEAMRSNQSDNYEQIIIQ